MWVLIFVALVAVTAEAHATRLYRATNLKVKRMKPAVVDGSDWVIVDVVDRDEESRERLYLLSAPGPERRWAWPALR